MFNDDTLLALAREYETELTEFRLSGNALVLKGFIEAALRADSLILVDDFYNALTSNEKIAFQFIREEINYSGNISIVKMIQKTNLSRPVWTSLLAKMEKFGIARVQNQGVKGTHIEISKEIDNEI